MEEYITIAEYAAKAGISRQAAYKRLCQPSCQPFVKTVNRRKYVNTAIFGDSCQPNCQPSCQPLSTDDNQVVNQVDSTTERLISTLEAQIREKDEQINRLISQLEQQQELLRNEQTKALYAEDHYRKLLAEKNTGFFKRLFQGRNDEK